MEITAVPTDTSWQVRIICSDCTGVDELGCFEGGWALLMLDEEGYFIAPIGDGRPARFGTEVQAESALEEVELAGPWDYEMVKA